jgi:hypothetical protein
VSLSLGGYELFKLIKSAKPFIPTNLKFIGELIMRGFDENTIEEC